MITVMQNTRYIVIVAEFFITVGLSIYDTRKRCVNGLQDVSGAEVETTCIDSRESHLNKAIKLDTSNDGFMKYKRMSVYAIDSIFSFSDIGSLFSNTCCPQIRLHGGREHRVCQ